MKILFLDIDGVLNNHNSKTMYLSGDDTKYGIDDYNLQQLFRIINECGCKIVWSTNWRNHPDNWEWGTDKNRYKSQFPKIRNLLKDYTHEDKYAPHKHGNLKAFDIAEWIQNHKEEMQGGCIAILDDMSTQKLDSYGVCFFQTDSNYGLTKEIADNIIAFYKAH